MGALGLMMAALFSLVFNIDFSDSDDDEAVEREEAAAVEDSGEDLLDMIGDGRV